MLERRPLHSTFRELNSTREWRKVELNRGESITLKPGKSVLCRTAERFVMPKDCAGALEGRSSFARLGLSVHAAGGFINPGWRGHMPLTLTNHSDVTLRIPCGISVCQLMIVQLAGVPENAYGESTSESKYFPDYAGPSLWRRDSLFQTIRGSVQTSSLCQAVFDELDGILDSISPDDAVHERLERYVEKSCSKFGSADELLSGFASSETKRERREKLISTSMRGALPTVGLAIAFPLLLLARETIWFPLGCLFLCLTVPISIAGVLRHRPQYLTSDVLASSRTKREKRSQSDGPQSLGRAAPA